MNDTTEGRETRALERAVGSSALLEALPIGVYCCGSNGIIRHFNHRAAELWGRAPKTGDTEERFCGAHKLFLPDGSSLPHDQTPMADVLKTRKPAHDLKVIVERPDGSRVQVLVNIDPLFDEDGTFIGAVNCFQDITDIVRANEELRQKNIELDDFFENGAIGLHIVGYDGTILRANRAELDLLGYDAPEYVGCHITDFHVDQPVIEDILERLSRGDQLDKYPARLRAKDGSIKHVLISSNGCFRDGAFVKTRCFTLDVTDAKLAQERVLEGERRFQDVLEGMPAAVYTVDAEGILTFCNHSAIALAGRTPELGVDRWCIFKHIHTTDGTLFRFEESAIATCLREKRPLQSEEFIAERPDGTQVRCVAYPTPLFDTEGRLTGAVNMLLDITARHNAEVESAHLAAIVSSSSDAIVSKALDGTIRSWNAGATRIFGYEPSEIIDSPITRIIPPELHEQEWNILARLQRGERIEHFETERITKDGRRIDVSLTVSPVHDKSGRIIGASKVARDITDRKRAERLQRLLISELNHRVKNTLATVQSIANQTVRLARSPTEFVASFSGRIQALSHTHDLLTRNSWQGADLLPLARDQLLLRGAEDPRIAFSGPSLTLDPQPALHLALILHELGTNARKYGSLSVPNGRLDVNWTVRSDDEGSHLLLRWTESGGPPVEVPATRGFGTNLIEKSLAAHGGRVTIHYHAEGLSCEVLLPIPERARSDEIALGGHIPSTTSAGPEALGSEVKVKGKRVLVVEDEALIAMDTAATLTEAGCVVVGPAATIEQARKLVGEGGFDVALLDANLAGERVETLAAALTRMGIPFAFLTGYEREALPEGFRQAPLVNKPFTRQDAVNVISRLTTKDGSVIPIRQKK